MTRSTANPGIGRHAVLLRGVNVGGRNRLPMADLRAMLESLGCGAVETYVQSGNAAFNAPASLARRLPALLAERIADELGLHVPLVCRSGPELREVVKANPFPDAEPGSLHVAFLAARPPKGVAALDPERSPGDRARLVGREVYLHLPDGVARTRYTNAYLDATLQTTSTVRNWRTVLRMSEMCETG